MVGVSQVSGGTGFAVIERSDPETDTCGEGIELRLRATFPPRAGTARLQLEGCEARIVKERGVTASFPLSSFVPGKEVDGGEKHASTAPTVTGKNCDAQLTLPHQTVQPWNVERDIPLDHDAILQASAGEGDAVTVLIGRVRKLQ